MKKVFLTTLIMIIVIVMGCKKKESAFTYSEHYTVTKVNLRDVIHQIGEIRAINKVELKSEASGQIKHILVKEGQKVMRGDTILIIDPARLLYQKQKLVLELKSIEIDIMLKQRDYKNGTEMVDRGSLSSKKLQDLQMAHTLATINYKQKQLELKDINEQLGKTVIIAPMSGILTNFQVEEGEIAVSATAGLQGGTSIGTIADISKLEVLSSIGEADFVHLHLNQKVAIRPVTVEDAQTSGTITFIALNAKKRNNDAIASFEVRITIDSIISGIAPGMNVAVDFVILEKDSVLGVPCHFIYQNNQQNVVDVLKGNSDKTEAIVSTPVNIGKSDYKYIEITGGLFEGDRLVYRHGSNRNTFKQVYN